MRSRSETVWLRGVALPQQHVRARLRNPRKSTHCTHTHTAWAVIAARRVYSTGPTVHVALSPEPGLSVSGTTSQPVGFARYWKCDNKKEIILGDNAGFRAKPEEFVFCLYN